MSCHFQTIKRKFNKKQKNCSKRCFCKLPSMNSIIQMKEPFVRAYVLSNIQLITQTLSKEYFIDGKCRRQKKTFGEFAKTLFDSVSVPKHKNCQNSIYSSMCTMLKASFKKVLNNEVIIKKRVCIRKEEQLTKLHEKQEKFNLLLSGYFRQAYSLPLPNDVITIVGYFARPICSRSQDHIEATYFIANVIHSFMTDPHNECEYCPNISNQLNILDYIFVRGGAIRDCVLLRPIKDVDIVIDTYGLNRAYLKHLQTYHNVYDDKKSDSGKNNSGSVDGDDHDNSNRNMINNTKILRKKKEKLHSKCIFWRHYCKKFSICDKNLMRTYHNTLDDHDITNGYSTHNKLFDKLFQWEEYIIHCNYILNAKFIIFEILEPLFRGYANKVILDTTRHRIGKIFTVGGGNTVHRWTGKYTAMGKYGYGMYSLPWANVVQRDGKSYGLQYGQRLVEMHDKMKSRSTQNCTNSRGYNDEDHNGYRRGGENECGEWRECGEWGLDGNGYARYEFIKRANVHYSIEQKWYNREYVFTLHGFGQSGHKYDINFDIVACNGNSYNLIYEKYKHDTLIEKENMLNVFKLYNIDIKSIEKMIDNYGDSLKNIKLQIEKKSKELVQTGIELEDNVYFEKESNDNHGDEYYFELERRKARRKLTWWTDFAVCFDEQVKLAGLNKIDIPLYPFPLKLNIKNYDFTINSMHIDLTSVLMIDNGIYPLDVRNKYNWATFGIPKTGINLAQFEPPKRHMIDYNWENKVKAVCNRYNRKYKRGIGVGNSNDSIKDNNDIVDRNSNNANSDGNVNAKDPDNTCYIDDIDIICQFNMLGLKDLSNKLLIAPDYKIITHGSSSFYFWRLVKICEKFIDKIDKIDKIDNKSNKSNKWTVDPMYVKEIQKHYKCWFNFDPKHTHNTNSNINSNQENPDDHGDVEIIRMFDMNEEKRNSLFFEKLLFWNIQDKFESTKYEKYDYQYYCRLVDRVERERETCALFNNSKLNKKKRSNYNYWYTIDYKNGYTIISIDSSNNIWYNRFKVLRYLGFEKEFKNKLYKDKTFAEQFAKRATHGRFKADEILPWHCVYQLEQCLEAFGYPTNEVGMYFCDHLRIVPQDVKTAYEIAQEKRESNYNYKSALEKYLYGHNYLVHEYRCDHTTEYDWEWVNTWEKPSWLVTKSWKQLNQWLLSYWHIRKNIENHICLKKRIWKKKKHRKYRPKKRTQKKNKKKAKMISYYKRKYDKKSNYSGKRKNENYLKWICKCGVDEWNQYPIYYV